jgi:hypothetical protein
LESSEKLAFGPICKRKVLLGISVEDSPE